VLPSQQPCGHELASHTHCPLVVLQSRFAPQGWHVAPEAPHSAGDSLP
jgi:hypothetical protein